jgi:hypothetical protein
MLLGDEKKWPLELDEIDCKSRRMIRKVRTMKTYFAVVDKDHSSAHGLWFTDVLNAFQHKTGKKIL